LCIWLHVSAGRFVCVRAYLVVAMLVVMMVVAMMVVGWRIKMKVKTVHHSMRLFEHPHAHTYTPNDS
jgi:hypothetical protein